MSRFLHPSALIPPGLIVDNVLSEGDSLIIFARNAAISATCPSCGQASGRLHSRYQRTFADLPASGRSVRIRMTVRRFRCVGETCRTRIFAEGLEGTIGGRYARRTSRLDCIVHQLGLALGGRPGQGFARRLMLPVSKDTLLRVVRRRSALPPKRPTVIGIDDWAYKRGQCYGTIVCDLERRRVVTLLPDRESSTIEAWLSQHSDIIIAARDRGGGYGEAIARALPGIIQVADRWHLMENASAAFLDAVRKCMALIRSAIGATVIDPTLLTYAERVQYEGYLRREAANASILALVREGVPIKQIAKRTGHSQKVVRNVSRGLASDIFRTRTSCLEAYLPHLEAEWKAGCRNGSELWRRLRAAGFRGSLRVVGEWATRHRRCEMNPSGAPRRVPSARSIARLMTAEQDRLSRDEAITVATVETNVPKLAIARELIQHFQTVIRNQVHSDLELWLIDAAGSLVSSFAAGIKKDQHAVAAALVQPWSNGQTEGQITRLKLIKRQMYGRAKLDLLQARLIGAT
jgi:transposase